jgi:Na+-driven multidrug efflux pump
MKEKPVFPLLVSMALPMVISMLVNSLYNIVDSFFVAQISEDAMTALSLVYPVFCKCRCHRFWNRTECGDFVLSGSG